MSFLEEIWWKSVLKVQFLRAKKFITWRSWLVLNPFRWPKFRLDIIYVFISHGWKPISIRRSSKMWIYQVFSCRKFVTEVYLRHVQKIITWSIFIVSSWFRRQNFTNWVGYIFTEGIEFKRYSKGLHFCSECVTRWKSWMLNIISSGPKLRKFITRSIFIGLDSYFYTRSLTHRSTTFLQKSRPNYAPINTSFLLKNVSESTLEPKISLSELKLQKFITNSPFIRLSRFSDRS